MALHLGGDDPAQMTEAARIAEDLGYDEVNINVGCPSDRVQSGSFGAVLMENAPLVADCVAAMRDACDAKFKDYAIYEHCLPFNVSRAYDEARGIDTPRIWTAERDLKMWEALQG